MLFNRGLVLVLIMIFLFGVFWWLETRAKSIEAFDNVWTSIGGKIADAGRSTAGYVRENTAYINIGDETQMRSQTDNMAYLESVPKPTTVQSIQMAAYNPSILAGDGSIYVPNPNITGISSLTRETDDYSLSEITTDLMNNNPRQKIQWDNVRIDISQKNRITVIPKHRTVPLMNDACSTKGLLNSDFKEDVCVKHAGNNKVINAKCQELTAENCKIPSCCVLLNGNMCVAGNKNGPTYLTQDGKELDYKYYVNKNKCYGDCLKSQRYESACIPYAKNSTGISKACMVQMFNNYGCPNKNPDALINDDMVKTYSKTSKQYVDNYIKTAVAKIKSVKDVQLCYGSADTNPSASVSGASSRAPAESFNDAGRVINTALSDMTS
jgi:hypothetical protein